MTAKTAVLSHCGQSGGPRLTLLAGLRQASLACGPEAVGVCGSGPLGMSELSWASHTTHLQQHTPCVCVPQSVPSMQLARGELHGLFWDLYSSVVQCIIRLVFPTHLGPVCFPKLYRWPEAIILFCCHWWRLFVPLIAC